MTKEELKEKIVELCRSASNLSIRDIVQTIEDTQVAFMDITLAALAGPERPEAAGCPEETGEPIRGAMRYSLAQAIRQTIVELRPTDYDSWETMEAIVLAAMTLMGPIEAHKVISFALRHE